METKNAAFICQPVQQKQFEQQIASCNVVGRRLSRRRDYPFKSIATLKTSLKSTKNNKDDPFDNVQKLESVKSGIVGALGGGIALAPISFVHNAFDSDHVVNSFAQWEFDTDMGSLEAALFAIVYRYCIRTSDNPMLNQGVVGAFIFVRTLSKIRVPSYCDFAPLRCGEPLEYFDYDMIFQGIWSGLESTALFGVAVLAMEYCFTKQYIQKFP